MFSRNIHRNHGAIDAVNVNFQRAYSKRLDSLATFLGSDNHTRADIEEMHKYGQIRGNVLDEEDASLEWLFE